MGTTLRRRVNFIGGVVENNPLASTGTVLNSMALSALGPSMSGAGLEYVPITLDPDGLDGPPEIAWITDYNQGAVTATILRGQEGTAARAHYQDTPWVHGPTTTDVGSTDADRWLQRTHGFLLEAGAGQPKRSWTGTHVKFDAFTWNAAGNGPHASTVGYQDFTMPAVNAVINGFGGASNKTVTAAGIPLDNWDCLWVVFTPGGGATGAGFAITASGTQFVVPSNWVRLCERNGADGRLYWADGFIQDYWRNVNGGIGFVSPFGQYAGQTTLGSEWTCRYRKENGMVHVEGLARRTDAANTSGHVLTLPVGYRPGTGTTMRNTMAGGGHVRIDINPAGNLIVVEIRGGADVTIWFSIAVSFVAEG